MVAETAVRLLGFSSSGVRPRTTMAAQLIAQRIRGKKPLTRREKLFLILDEPTSSALAHFFSLMVTTVTLVATFASTVETVRNPNNFLGALNRLTSGGSLFFGIRYTCGFFFVTEAVMRVACYIPLRRVFLDPFIWLDCLTPLPFIFGLFFGRLPVLEAWGSIRLFKLCRYYEGAGLLSKAFRSSMEQLGVPLFMLATMVICFSSVLYQVEYDEAIQQCVELWKAEADLPDRFFFDHPGGVAWGCDVCPPGTAATDAAAGAAAGAAADTTAATPAEVLLTYRCATCAGHPAGHPECSNVAFEQQFQSVPHAMWFLIVTVTTVGFGDVSPSTTLGQLFISAVILLGILFLAMPLSVVGSNFQQAWDDRTLYKLQALTRQMLSENDMKPDDCITAFKQFDVDGDGLVDEKEFAHFVVGVLGLNLKKPELVKLWAMLDANHSGSINFTEFAEMLFPGHTFSEESMGDKGEDEKVGEHTFKLRQAAAADTALARARDGVGVLDSAEIVKALSRDSSCVPARPPTDDASRGGVGVGVGVGGGGGCAVMALDALSTGVLAAFGHPAPAAAPAQASGGASRGHSLPADASTTAAVASAVADAVAPHVASAVASSMKQLGQGGALATAVAEQLATNDTLASSLAKRIAVDVERSIERCVARHLGHVGHGGGAHVGSTAPQGHGTAAGGSAEGLRRGAPQGGSAEEHEGEAPPKAADTSTSGDQPGDLAASLRALEATVKSMHAHLLSRERRSRRLHLRADDSSPSLQPDGAQDREPSRATPSRETGTASFIRRRLGRVSHEGRAPDQTLSTPEKLKTHQRRRHHSATCSVEHPGRERSVLEAEHPKTNAGTSHDTTCATDAARGTACSTCNGKHHQNAGDGKTSSTVDSSAPAGASRSAELNA